MKDFYFCTGMMLARLLHFCDLGKRSVILFLKSLANGDEPADNQPQQGFQKALEYGYHPEMILAGHCMNDSKGEIVADQMVKLMLKKGIQVLDSNILVLGLTFKEICPDVRNPKVMDIVKTLQNYKTNIIIYDPWANPSIAKHEY